MKDKLTVFGTALPIRETFLQCSLSSFLQTKNNGDSLKRFKALDKGLERRSNCDTLVSLCLFAKENHLTVNSHHVSFNDFDKILPSGDITKYYDPLILKRRTYGKRCWIRVYLDPRLKNLSKFLLNWCDLDELVIMDKSPSNFYEAMLWRYLPITDTRFEKVFCAGIDNYDNDNTFIREMVDRPCEGAKLCAWMNRFYMPLAGPAVFNPQFISELFEIKENTIDNAILNFLDSAKKRIAIKPKILDQVTDNGGQFRPTIDAAMLSAFFWNEKFMTNEKIELTSQVFYKFGRIIPVSFKQKV